MRVDTVWHGARLMTLAGAGLGIVDRGVVAALEGRIVYAGAAADAPRFDAARQVDCEGRWIGPGLIDCHTHLVHGGNRAAEFERRLEGASYADIAAAGGGIRATVAATRAADEAALIASATPRLAALVAEGVTTVEIKSGYGLDLPTELRMLRAARALADRRVRVVTSFLGLHAVPDGDDADDFVDRVCAWLPDIAPFAQAADAFCETLAFTPAQVSRYFDAASRAGLLLRLHADQLSNTGGAALAASHGALSADHLEYTDAPGVAAMARAGTVAVLLPGAFYCLREPQAPPVAALRAAGVKIALATDCNPGTSPVTSLLLTMNLGATLFRLTVAECIAGVTREAARALGQTDIGTLQAGKRCDLAIWSVETPAELVYRMGLNPLFARVWGGE